MFYNHKIFTSLDPSGTTTCQLIAMYDATEQNTSEITSGMPSLKTKKDKNKILKKSRRTLQNDWKKRIWDKENSFVNLIIVFKKTKSKFKTSYKYLVKLDGNTWDLR